MGLKEKLDKHREGFPSRFTEEQRRVLEDFQGRIAAMVRKVPKAGDILPSLTPKGAEERRKEFKHLALLFFRGSW